MSWRNLILGGSENETFNIVPFCIYAFVYLFIRLNTFVGLYFFSFSF